MKGSTEPNAKDIFLEALDRDGPDRTRFLQERCAGDAALHGRVIALLGAHERAGQFMEGVTVGGGGGGGPVPPDGRTREDLMTRGAPAGAAGAQEARIGETIGAYTLVKKLGEGGFGTVFLADQSEPVRRKVALKILKLGMDTEQVIARFEVERQALAMMDHPSIAKVLDAGATQRGRPFFVMELVQGEPIDRFCDRRKLSVKQRLALFEQVCLAVQHAHQKGIIHRDLKPSNVMVTVVDGKPLPKIIDFGIAKATEARLSEASALTDRAQLVGTPEYMSPEQASLATADIDTRSDVYSLGVILYEMLTGQSAFDRERIRRAGLTELQRIIREEVPVRPSSRLGTRADARADVEAVEGERSSARGGLRRSVAGELDWIVMKCLEKDRRKRYQTAYALASDIGRYLRGEPIEASPPSRVYRMRKFVSRNRPQVVAAAVAGAALIALGVGGTVFGLRAADAEHRALVRGDEAARQTAKYRAIAEFNESILEAAGPGVANGEDTVLLRRIIDDAVVRMDEDRDLVASPEVTAPIRVTIANTYRLLGDLDRALRQAEAALREARRAYGMEHEEALDALNTVGSIHAERREFHEARSALERCAELSSRVLGPEHDATLQVRNALAQVYREMGNTEQAIGMMQTVREARLHRGARLRQASAGELSEREAAGVREQLANNTDSLLTVTNNLGLAYQQAGQREAAVPLLREVIEAQLARGGSRDKAAITMNNLGQMLLELERVDEGRELLEQAMEIKREVLPQGHPSIIIGLNGLAQAYDSAGDLEGAEAYYLEALELARETVGERHQFTLILRNNMGKLYKRAGRPEDALGALSGVVEAASGLWGDDNADTQMMRANLATLYVELGRFEEGERTARAAVDFGREAFEAQSERLAVVLQPLGEALTGLGRLDEAQAVLDECAAIWAAQEHVPARQRGTLARALADLYEAQGRDTEAAQQRAEAEALLGGGGGGGGDRGGGGA